MPVTLQRHLAQLLPQPVVGCVLAIMALAALATAWVMEGLDWSISLLGLSLGLCGAIVVAYRYPVHLRHQTKVLMVTTVYYLLAVLVPPPLAALAAGVGAVAGELSQRSRSGAYASDIASEAGRRVLIVLLGALVAHSGAVPQPAALVGTLLVLAGLDMLSLPLVLAAMSGDRPLQVLVPTVLVTWQPDGVQYLIGLLGVIAARTYVWSLLLLIVPALLINYAFKILKELHDNTQQLLESMADAVDLRDAYTGGHSRRVTEFSAAILRELGVKGPEVRLILAAARVHDVGKIGIPDAVLHKPGRLTAEERALMELHPVHGAHLLERYGDFARGVELVLHHHEAWDGTGYPHKLRGLQIPFGARVIAVADSFDAMTSDRPYRRGMSVQQASEILRAGRGQQWDKSIVDALLLAPEHRLEHVVSQAPSPVEVASDPGPVPTAATA